MYLYLYVFWYLPAFLVGCLPNKTRVFFAVIAALGLIFCLVILFGLSSTGAPGVGGEYGGLGLALAAAIPTFLAPIFAGILAGALFRTSMTYFKGTNGAKKYFVTLAPLLIPLGVALGFVFKDYAERKSIKDARITEVERLWMTDVTFRMDKHILTLPFATRLRLQYSGDDDERNPKDPYKQVYSLKIDGPQHLECKKRVQSCTSIQKREEENWKRWCKFRPDLTDTFWCADELNVLRIKLTNRSVASFEKRKFWLENPNSEERPPLAYRGKDTELIIHEALGRDRREEIIFSVCSGRACTLDYAVEEDILAQIRYSVEQGAITDEDLRGYINTVEARWKSWQESSDELN